MVVCEIQSILGAIRTGLQLDLGLISRLFHVKRKSLVSSNLSFRLESPDIAVIFYQSGIIAFAGAKSFEEIDEAKKAVLRELEKAGIIEQYDFKLAVWNIVATANLARELDIEKLSECYYDQMTYIPETFPGLIFHKRNSRMTVLAFGSGKLVLTGVKKVEDLENLLSHFLTYLDVLEPS